MFILHRSVVFFLLLLRIRFDSSFASFRSPVSHKHINTRAKKNEIGFVADYYYFCCCRALFSAFCLRAHCAPLSGAVDKERELIISSSFFSGFSYCICRAINIDLLLYSRYICTKQKIHSVSSEYIFK